MPESPAFLDLLETRLRPCVPNLRTRAMFGGVGLFAGPAIFGFAGGGEVYLSTDDGNRGRFEAAGMPPLRPWPDGPVTMKYHRVPDEVFADHVQLSEWIAAACDAAARKAKPAKPKRPVKRRGG